MTSSIDDDTLARLRLLWLEDMGPSRLRWLLADHSAPEVVEILHRGRLPDGLGPPPPGLKREVIERWPMTIRRAPVERTLAIGERLGIQILSPHDGTWPFADDPEPPGLLFCLGDLDLLSAAGRVGVVGTRRCTAVGRTVANRLGREIAEAGGVVVSGLALGVDGAAHRGVLERGGKAVGVVGSGLDVVYPKANQDLWEAVGKRGLLISEWPATVRPKPWRFPARNRLIAGLSEAVVVVESHDRGGALSTADEALRRDLPVMVVPGSVLSPASEGTNALLVDGAIPVRDAGDVLAYLGHQGPGPGRESERPRPVAEPLPGLGVGAESSPEGLADRILFEVSSDSQHLDQLVLGLGVPVADVLAAVQELQADGLVELDGSTVSLRPPR